MSTTLELSGVQLEATRRVTDAPGLPAARIADLIAIARPDYWSKKVVVLSEAVVGLLHRQALWRNPISNVLPTIACSCLVSSSDYALNEILAAGTDPYFAEKRPRPIASGRLSSRFAIVEWLILAATGFATAAATGLPVLLCAISLWVMVLAYNVPPVRSKELPIIDVLSEAVNNPIRFALGWPGSNFSGPAHGHLLRALGQLEPFFCRANDWRSTGTSTIEKWRFVPANHLHGTIRPLWSLPCDFTVSHQPQ
jgi:UbiA prenyltransferase family